MSSANNKNMGETCIKFKIEQDYNVWDGKRH